MAHLVVSFVADAHGEMVTLGVREERFDWGDISFWTKPVTGCHLR